jgi:hypothetical protein
MKVNGFLVPSGTGRNVNSNFANVISEDPKTGYHPHGFIAPSNAKCPAALNGTATLDEGETITCYIENDDNP